MKSWSSIPTRSGSPSSSIPSKNQENFDIN
jgi:hypothetical protein